MSHVKNICMEKDILQNGLLYFIRLLYYFEAHTLPFTVRIQQMSQYFKHTHTHTHTHTSTHTHTDTHARTNTQTFANWKTQTQNFSYESRVKNGQSISNLLLQFVKDSWVQSDYCLFGLTSKRINHNQKDRNFSEVLTAHSTNQENVFQAAHEKKLKI